MLDIKHCYLHCVYKWSQLLSVTVLGEQRGALWLLKPHVLFAFKEKTRALAGNSHYTTASGRHCQ